MPNYCNYELLAKGSKENLLKLKEVFQSNYNYKKQDDGAFIENDCNWKHLFRVFEAESIENDLDEGEINIYGYCAWSVYCCMCEGEYTYYSDTIDEYGDAFKGTTLQELSRELNLDIEIFSDESGCGFMEHYAYRKGECIHNECVDWVEAENEETGEYITVSGGLEWDYTI